MTVPSGSSSGSEEDHLDVREFFASPRHAFFFRTDPRVQEKIEARRAELNATGKLLGKTPIINLQTHPAIVELHDGNASVVAWLLSAIDRGIAPTLRALKESFEFVVILHDLVHESGEVWQPFVPPEVACADRLQSVPDPEQDGREVRKAITHEGEIAAFDNREFFSGADSSERLGAIAHDHQQRLS